MFNEFFLKCYEASVRKGFYESPPDQRAGRGST
jgi:hypothetical protein